MNALIPYIPAALSTEHVPDDWQRAFVLWLSELRSLNTRKAYELAWRQFAVFGGLHPGAVESEHVRAWKIVLQKKHEPPTVNLKLSAVSSFYAFVNEHYAFLRDDNPCESVKRMTFRPYGKTRYLQDNQDKELLASIERDSRDGKRDYAIVLLMLVTGVRVSAVANATRKSFIRQGAVLFFEYIGKGGDNRRKRLPANAAVAVTDWLDVWRGVSLFGLTRFEIRTMIIARCDTAFGVGHGITPHSLRHTAAIQASKRGSIRDVQTFLDHSSTRVTDIYLNHVDNSAADSMAALLDERYGN